MLLDRKALKQSLVNGISSFLTPHQMDPTISFQGARQGSEPPQISSTDYSTIISSAKDDAHDVFVSKGKTQKAPHSQAQTPVPESLFDAKQLLDPKSFQKGQQSKDVKAKDECATSGSEPKANGLLKRDVEDTEGLGAGSLIERMHNVSQRDGRPHKKQKSTGDEQKDKESNSKFTGGGRGGDLGAYIKEEREKGLESNGVHGAVDLTATGKMNHFPFFSSFLFHFVRESPANTQQSFLC